MLAEEYQPQIQGTGNAWIRGRGGRFPSVSFGEKYLSGRKLETDRQIDRQTDRHTHTERGYTYRDTHTDTHT